MAEMDSQYGNEPQVFDAPVTDEPAASFRLGPEFERFLEQAERARGSRSSRSLRSWLDLAEAWRITRALSECGGNRSAAARSLGIGRRTLYSKMSKLGIEPRWQV